MKLQRLPLWAVVDKDGMPRIGTISFLRRDSIAFFLAQWTERQPWRTWRRRGFRAERVTITAR